MKLKSLGIGLLALSVTAVGTAAYLVRRPAPAPAPVAASAAVTSAEPEKSPALATSSAPAPAVERERPAPAPAPVPKPVNTTPVPAAKTNQTPAPPAVAVPTAVPDPPVATEPAPQKAPVAAPPEPPKPRYEEVTVSADSVLGVTVDSTISSETAKVEDRVNARVSRDVIVDGKIAVPVGARLEGVVTDVVRGGKFKERPRVGVTFQQLILADGTKIALSTDTVFRDGEAPAGVNAKVGGSGVVGAILGAMIGGKKGAVLGGAAAAAGGAAVVAAGDRAEVVLLSGSSLTVRLKAPITILVERHDEDPSR